MLGESRLMACPTNVDTILVAHVKSRSSSQKTVSSAHSDSDGFTSTLQDLISFCITCRLLETGAWIHVGENMENLLDARCMAEQKQKGRLHVNVPGVSLAVTLMPTSRSQAEKQAITVSIKAYPFAARVLRLRADADGCIAGNTVFCLPRLAVPAIAKGLACPTELTAPFKTPDDFNKFWLLQHGYKLPAGATSAIVKVSFGHFTLHYPIGCCWQSKLIEL
ncbi:hypothetical protein BESB_044560, partial [Besnoitia besnoiti]